MDLNFGDIRFVPIVHRRVTFAEQVRLAALEHQPDLIAVELPPTLQPWIEEGVERLPRISAVCWEETDLPGALQYLPIDPCDGLIEAVRLGLENQIPVAFIDLDLPGLRESWHYAPDDLIVDKSGLARYVEALSPYLRSDPTDPRALAREAQMASALRSFAGRRVLCVLGLAHFELVRAWVEHGVGELPPEAAGLKGLRERPGAHLAHVAADSVAEMLGEMPWLAWKFEQSRETLDLAGEARFDKLAAIQDLIGDAQAAYEKRYREQISVTQRRGMLQYMRNLAMVSGRLRPDLYEVVCAARGMVDGDFGWEVFELARAYPPQADPPENDLPKLTVNSVRNRPTGRLSDREERFLMQPFWENPPSDSVSLGFRRRPPRRMQELWKALWDKDFKGRICSWPPEDEIQERFMDYVRKRALQHITEDRKQVQEFSTSILDGLDIRETMRNWDKGKLYVQQTPQPHGRVGSVVLIFQDEPLDAPASWRTTLYAEHRNESDISFFATPLGEQVVGPRICRTEFGGILSVWPAWGIPNIWSFGMSDEIHSAGDALLAAGILFSPDKYVAYIAPRPPRGTLKTLAAANRKQIIYLPLASFSRSHLRRIRRFHILDGHDVRAWARDYIFED